MWLTIFPSAILPPYLSTSFQTVSIGFENLSNPSFCFRNGTDVCKEEHLKKVNMMCVEGYKGQYWGDGEQVDSYASLNLTSKGCCI